MRLSGGSIGISYVLREDLPQGCSAFPHFDDIIGMDASDASRWFYKSENVLERSVGAAVLCAASRSLPIPDEPASKLPFGIDVTPKDTVAMIGFIPPVARSFQDVCKKMYIFDNGASSAGPLQGCLSKAAAFPISDPEAMQAVLESCSIITMSGTTLINESAEEILSMAENAREIVIVGPSTPMIPDGYSDFGVTRLAGSWWDEKDPSAIAKTVSRAGGIMQLHGHMIKKMAML